jgi:hypothetical protein
MGIVSLSTPEVPSADERWERWETRNRKEDARFRRRMGRVLWAAVAVGTVTGLFLFLTR